MVHDFIVVASSKDEAREKGKLLAEQHDFSEDALDCSSEQVIGVWKNA
jgi:hypothetical protein